MQFTDYDGPVVSSAGRKANPEILEIERALRRIYETRKPLLISGLSDEEMDKELQRIRNTAGRLGLAISTGVSRNGDPVIKSVTLKSGRSEPQWRVELESATQPEETPKPAKRSGRSRAAA